MGIAPAVALYGAQEPRTLNQPLGAASIAGQPGPGPAQETEDQAPNKVKFLFFAELGLRFYFQLQRSGVNWEFLKSHFLLPLFSGAQSAWR